MNRRSKSPTPEAILQLERQFEDFRSSQSRRTKLPESLWRVAVELAQQYGLYTVAHPLRLDYMGLKKRLSEVAAQRCKATVPAFVELVDEMIFSFTHTQEMPWMLPGVAPTNR